MNAKKLSLMQARVDSLVVSLGLSQNLKKWKFTVKDVDRGWCYPHTKRITIPAFAMDLPRIRRRLSEHGFDKTLASRYLDYYICHEAAHAISREHNHTIKFMKTLIKICPKDIVAFELMYKPKLAAAAGITREFN